MILLRLCRNILLRLLVVMVIISALNVPSAYCQETEDSQVFIAGFNAYQLKDYASSIEKMNEVLQKFPDTPLRDMVLFWLSRSYYKAGNHQEAARYLSQFSKEYPDNPLKSTVEEELISLTARYDRGEKLPAGTPPVKQPDRLAAQKAKAEKERVAAVKADEAKRAADAAELARIAALKQAEENAAAEKKEQERVAAAKAEQERIAAAKTEEAKLAAAAAAESARMAALKQVEEKTAADRAAEQQQIDAANGKKELERIAAGKAEQEQIAAAKAKENKSASSAKATQSPLAATKADEALRVEAAAETARIAADKAARERIVLAKAEEAKQTEAAAKAARVVSAEAKEERKAAELAAKKTEERQQAAVKSEEARLAQRNLAEEKANAVRSAYREKAIGQYKAIIEKYPTSTAAVTAATKLRELGVAVALPSQPVDPPQPENAQVLRIEVAQFAGFEFNLLARPDSFTVGRPIAVPFEVTNRGNGKDSFNLESGFPTEFKARFAAASTPATAITQTPDLAPGETFNGVIDLVIPPGSIDGLRITQPVKVSSRLMPEASQSREVKLVASAPLLRAVLRTEKTKPLPGDKVVYRIAILNIGSTVAQDVTFRLDYPPQLEPVDFAAAGLRQETPSVLISGGLQVNSGESREFNVTFLLKDDSLAGQELSTRAELVNTPLKTTASFVSNISYVESQRSISVRSAPERLTVIPGQTITVPFVVTNNGNIREKFSITSILTGTRDAVIFNDLNRDGIRQASEPEINEIGPLAPREEASVVVEIRTPKGAADGSQGRVQITFASEGDTSSSASGSTQLTYSRPVLKMVMSGRDGRLVPGDVASFDLMITNNGSNLARIVELQSAWPEQLELVAAEPSTSSVSNGTIIWRFKEMGAGEKRSIKVSFRVKPVTGAGTAVQVKNTLTYEDQLGSRY